MKKGKWHLATNPPTKSGDYVVILKHGNKYEPPEALSWSMVHSAWNASDTRKEADFKYEDLRDKDLPPSRSYVYAWYDPDLLTPEELDAMQPSPGKWTPVSAAMPETGEIVLLFVASGKNEHLTFENAPAFGGYDEVGGWFLEDYPGTSDLVITHWMPLPTDPEVEK